MATSPNLPIGAFITTLGGRRCTALPRTDISSAQTSTPAAFPTSVILSAIPAVPVAPQVEPAPAVQSTVEPTVPAPAPAPAAPTTRAESKGLPSVIAPSSSSSLPPSSIPAFPFSAAAVAPKPQASVADKSTTALSTALTTPAANTAAPIAAAAPTTTAQTPAPTTVLPQVVPVPAQSEVLQSETPKATPFTIIGLSSTTIAPGGGGLGARPTGSSAESASGNGGSGSKSNGNAPTVAVAGGIVGGVALISLIAFLIWFWRRRKARKQRDTLLTPLTADPSFGREIRNEKAPYNIQRGSAGPIPRSAKVKAAVRAQYGRVRGRNGHNTSISSIASHTAGRSVDMNRGNSQFMDTTPIMAGHARNVSSALSSRDDSDLTLKGRIVEMLTRFTGSGKQNLAGDDRNDIFAARGITGGQREGTTTRPVSNKPDFLTLLNMDDRELDREAQRRRMSRRGASEGSALGGLSLDFGGNPFSDAHAVTTRQSRNGPPLASGANNPFADANAITPPKPSTYVDGIRRSRHQSLSAGSIDLNKAYDVQGLRVVNQETRPPSRNLGTLRQDGNFFRDSQASAGSFESFITKRDKFRSDPFDLERLASPPQGSIPSFYPVTPGYPSAGNPSAGATRLSSSGSISMQYQMTMGSDLAPGPLVTRPAAAHARKISETSSKYTSGFSAISTGTLEEWSEPGPDVGPATRWDASRRSSGTNAFPSYSEGSPSTDRSRSNSRTGSNKSGSSKMGYAL